ncbi:hypothetical protein V5T82_04450 [Magnetovibrio sp. PR-2]|uniref:hypothetical protein n=1 Tax=Magnetovibrio sp. PR-2 TaxID=3120356 RepID=UPI002FCDE2D9
MPAVSSVFRFICTACLVSASLSQAHGSEDVNVVFNLTDDNMKNVLDIRDMDACSTGSLPRARCLPLDHFRDPAGNTINFHALRWLLGTVGLSGEESLLVIGSTGDEAFFVGALLHQAGQNRVQVFAHPFRSTADAPSGTSRSFSREAVFTAPMRYTKN